MLEGRLTYAGIDWGRRCTGYAYRDGQVVLDVTDGQVFVTFYSESAVEVVFLRVGEGEGLPPSRAIGTSPASVAVTQLLSKESIRFMTPGIEVWVFKNPFRLAFYYQGRELIREEMGYLERDERIGFRFSLDAAEKLYGGGSRVFGRMNRRGERLDLYNSACYGYGSRAPLMYYSMPAVLSSRKYMLVFDNGARGRLDLDSKGDGILEFEAVGGRAAYVLIAGDSWPNLSSHVADITGHQPMLPRWALGDIASRMGYHTQAEVESVVAQFVAQEIPLDAVVLDLFWFGESIFGNMGNLDWDRKTFPDPVAMLQSNRAQGVKTVLVTEPMLLCASSNWLEAVRRKVLATDEKGRPYKFQSFFGESGLIDVFKPEAREWFWSFYKKQILAGVAGWWGDLAEPETHPSDLQHAAGGSEELHNFFGHEWTRLIYEGYRRDFPDQRPFILLRAGFAGTQRYGILPWSGDVARSWEGLQAQPELILQMGMQGVAYMHSDLGGFAGNTRDPELYVRWLQFGCFQPIFRLHGHEEVPPEPIFWDEQTRARAREAIQLRYRFMPYNYTLMYENSLRGWPLMRPLLFLDDDMDPEILDAYLWGDAILVAPITRPGVTQISVPLPGPMAWFDFLTDERHEGGQTTDLAVSPDHIPVLVRGGSFVPLTTPVQSSDLYNGLELELHYYDDPQVASSSGRLYDDDGKTFGAFEKGQYDLFHFSSKRNGEGRVEIQIEADDHDYPGRPENRVFRLTVHGLKASPKEVIVDQQTMPVAEEWPTAGATPGWDAEQHRLVIPLTWTGAARVVSWQSE